MNPSNLTVEQVRGELARLVEEFPDRNGKVITEGYAEDGFTCVYYTDETGLPITIVSDYGPSEQYEPRLVNPVCIVGQWIESFHAEFKEDELIKEILLKNRVLAQVDEEATPFRQDVLSLLAKVQRVQDDDNARWSDIADWL